MNKEKWNGNIKWAFQWECSRIWLKQYPNPHTQVLRAYQLRRFCEWAGLTPPELLNLKTDYSDVRAERLIDKFSVDAPYNEPTKINIIAAIRSFFRRNYKALQQTGMPEYYTPDKYDLDKQKLWKLYLACANPRDRALFTFIFATAAAKETIVNAKWKHLEPDWETQDCPCLVFEGAIIKGHGRGKYAGVKQITFLTPEAKANLMEYKEWIQNKIGREFEPDEHIFWTTTTRKIGYLKPLGYGALTGFQERLTEKTGIKWRLHDGRRWVETALEKARVPANWRRKIRGRKVRGEESPYSKPKIEELREAYRTAVPYLSFIPKSEEEQYAHALAQARALLATLPAEIAREALKTFLDNLPAAVARRVEETIKIGNTNCNGSNCGYIF